MKARKEEKRDLTFLHEVGDDEDKTNTKHSCTTYTSISIYIYFETSRYSFILNYALLRQYIWDPKTVLLVSNHDGIILVK